MKLIEYSRYKNWSPRSTILLLVVDAIVTGFFLAATLFDPIGQSLNECNRLWVLKNPVIGSDRVRAV